jgi:hypothetical protein
MLKAGRRFGNLFAQSLYLRVHPPINLPVRMIRRTPVRPWRPGSGESMRSYRSSAGGVELFSRPQLLQRTCMLQAHRPLSVHAV